MPKPFQDDSVTSKVLYLRKALMDHLDQDPKAMQYFNGAQDGDDAKTRLIAIMNGLPQARNVLNDTIETVAQAVADVYWRK